MLWQRGIRYIRFWLLIRLHVIRLNPSLFFFCSAWFQVSEPPPTYQNCTVIQAGYRTPTWHPFFEIACLLHKPKKLSSFWIWFCVVRPTAYVHQTFSCYFRLWETFANINLLGLKIHETKSNSCLCLQFGCPVNSFIMVVYGQNAFWSWGDILAAVVRTAIVTNWQ